MSKPVLILKTGSSFPALAQEIGDFEHWIAAGLASADTGLEVSGFDPRDNDDFPDPDTIAGVVVTGSHAMVSQREAWSERSAQWLAGLDGRNVPVLGICYGHQLLAHAFGGEVGYHPGGIEVGTVTVRLRGEARADPLFSALPEAFAAHVVHRQSVAALPPGAVRLAENAFEPYHAFRLGRHMWGVQFHPEFSSAAMRGYLDHMSAELAAEGHDTAAISAGIGATDAAASLLPRFAHIVSQAVRTG